MEDLEELDNIIKEEGNNYKQGDRHKDEYINSLKIKRNLLEITSEKKAIYQKQLNALMLEYEKIAVGDLKKMKQNLLN